MHMNGIRNTPQTLATSKKKQRSGCFFLANVGDIPKILYLCARNINIPTMTTAAMNGLWQYLQTLSLTDKNRRWLAEKLIENQAGISAKEAEEQRLWIQYQTALGPEANRLAREEFYSAINDGTLYNTAMTADQVDALFE